MAGYKPVAIQTYPVLGEKITQDTLYWNNYKAAWCASGYSQVNESNIGNLIFSSNIKMVASVF